MYLSVIFAFKRRLFYQSFKNNWRGGFSMKRKLLLALACLALMATLESQAQEKGDISTFGGYSHYIVDGNNGWNVSLAGNVTKHLALVTDASEHFKSANYAKKDFSLTFGPRYIHTIRNRVTPFAHFLFGLEHESPRARYEGLFSKPSYRALNALVYIIGGGADVRISNRLSVRALQIDLGCYKNSSSIIGLDGYLRASFGVVFRLTNASK
jgi:hypothetical protein